MNPEIDAIFLDVGNTLRIVVEDAEFSLQAKKDIMSLVGADEPMESFFKKLYERWNIYRKYSKTELLEASEHELWTQWLLPDYPVDLIAPHAGRLTRLWRDRDGRRVPRDDAKATILELHRRGYLLGIIANTITETEIPDWMMTDQVTGYFKTVILSSKVRVRKPDPQIYWLASRLIGVEPAKCAYLGDNPVRDVEGTRAAGYGMMILFEEPATLAKEPQTGEQKADYAVRTMSELLNIFPEREPIKAAHPTP